MSRAHKPCSRVSRRRALRLLPSFAFACALVPSRPVAGLQPIETFLRAARLSNPENREVAAVYRQRDDERSAATWRLLPSLSAVGSYTRNQYERVFNLMQPEPLRILLNNQLDATISLNIPLVDVGAWERRAAATAVLDAASASSRAVALDVERRVVRAYYQLLGSEAVLESARRSLGVANENASVVRDRRQNGLSSELDLQRAEADVARAQQDVAAADLSATTARRQLATLSGIDPEGATEFPNSDLAPEAPLEAWLRLARGVPAVDAARASRVAAERSVGAQRAASYPTLMGTAQEHLTNATGFIGHTSYYALQVSLSWRFDGASYYAPAAQAEAAAAARAREDKSVLDAQDAIYQAWHQVRTGIERSRAARAQAAAALRSAELARQLYAEGVATQLDVLIAQQDAFRADVGRIQADADLTYARAALRLYAARSHAAEGP